MIEKYNFNVGIKAISITFYILKVKAEGVNKKEQKSILYRRNARNKMLLKLNWLNPTFY